MNKKIKSYIKLILPAGKATASPPVGPALGQHGLNIGLFCKDYNAKTADKIGYHIPVKILVYTDRTYSLIFKMPPASELLKKVLEINEISEKSASKNNLSKKKITKEQIKEIALQKIKDLNTKDLKKAIKTIEGTARNMGIIIEN